MPLTDRPRLMACSLDTTARRLDFTINTQYRPDAPTALRLAHSTASRTFDLPVTQSPARGGYSASFPDTAPIAPGTWELRLVYPDGTEPVAITAREAAIVADQSFTVGDAVVMAAPSTFGHLELTVTSIYDVSVADARTEDEHLLLSLTAHRALPSDTARWAVRLNDLTAYTDTTLELAPEWTSMERHGDDPTLTDVTLRIPTGELLSHVDADGTYRMTLICTRPPASSLAESINRAPATVGLTVRSVPDALPPLSDHPSHAPGGARITWFREGRSGIGVKINSDDLRADIARIDVDSGTIRFALTIDPLPSHDRPLVARLTNRLSGEDCELPVAIDAPGPSIALELAELTESALAQDGQYDIRLRHAHGTWLHQIGTIAAHQARQAQWTFPAGTMPTSPTQRIRPYFTTEDTIAVLSTPLVRTRDLTVTRPSGPNPAQVSFTAVSAAVPDWAHAPRATALVWRSQSPPPTILAQASTTVAPNTFRYQLTLGFEDGYGEASIATLAAAIDRAEALVEFDDGDDAAPISARLRRGRASKPAPPARLIPRLAKRMLEAVRTGARMAFYRRAAAMAPIRPRTAVFQSFLGDAYADSPRAIAEALAARDRRLKIYWVASDGKALRAPSRMRQIHAGTWPYYWHLATARYFVANTNFPNFLIKRRGQQHLQTWHGTPLKRIGMDVAPTAPGYRLQDNPDLHRRIARWDAVVSPSAFSSKIYASAFAHRARVIERGYPRNDILVDAAHGSADTRAVRTRLGIAHDATVVLYMPTFRDDTPAAHRSFLPIPIRRLARALGPNTTVLLRLHYTVSATLNVPFDLPQVRDVSNYEDSAELLAIADALITDYSSVFYDYSILRRPIVFYTHDLDSYEFTSRGFYWDFRRFNPWPIVRTTDELIRHAQIAVNEPESFPIDEARAEAFRAVFTGLETGCASTDVVDDFFRGGRHG